MPQRGIWYVLERGYFGLGEYGYQVMGDAEGVGAVKEGMRAVQRGYVADIGRGSLVVNEAKRTKCESCCIIWCVFVD